MTTMDDRFPNYTIDELLIAAEICLASPVLSERARVLAAKNILDAAHCKVVSDIDKEVRDAKDMSNAVPVDLGADHNGDAADPGQ